MTPSPPDVDLEAIRRARERIGPAVRSTPLQYSQWLSQAASVPVYLKLECWQRTRSFKFRGAYNAVAALDPEARDRGLVTASAGNHGLALALAASLHETSCTVFVPEDASLTKKDRIRRMGGDLREVSGIYDDAADIALDFAESTGGHYLSAFTDPDVVAGQGTLGLEILDELPEVREVVIPVGGGGLLAGVGIALESSADGSVVGVQSTSTTAMHAAFKAGEVVPVRDPWLTLCDGLAGKTEPVAYERARAVTDTIHLVDELRVAPAIRALYHSEAVVSEGSGAVGVAAVLDGVIQPEGPTVVVISGGNIDMATLAQVFAQD
jgi:threonine dehydratase